MGLGPRASELNWVLRGEPDPCFLRGNLFTKNMSTLMIYSYNIHTKAAPPHQDGKCSLVILL